MATLAELSEEYRMAAVLLNVGIAEEKERLKEGDDLAAVRIRMLRSALNDMRKLRRLTRDYYTRARDPLFTMSHLTVRGKLND